MSFYEIISTPLGWMAICIAGEAMVVLIVYRVAVYFDFPSE